jgi:hypothetical protein
MFISFLFLENSKGMGARRESFQPYSFSLPKQPYIHTLLSDSILDVKILVKISVVILFVETVNNG